MPQPYRKRHLFRGDWTTCSKYDNLSKLDGHINGGTYMTI